MRDHNYVNNLLYDRFTNAMQVVRCEWQFDYGWESNEGVQSAWLLKDSGSGTTFNIATI